MKETRDKKTHVRGKCKTAFCRNNPDRRTYCSTCRKRNSRKRDPMRYAFETLKFNAKRRKKAFTLTFKQFATWATEHDYLASKGRTSTSYTIDRDDENEGYHIWNLRLRTLADNVAKSNQHRAKIRMTLSYDYQSQTAAVFKRQVKQTT